MTRTSCSPNSRPWQVPRLGRTAARFIREEQQAENLRKMMLAMVDDIRVVLIKLADRLHNMRTLKHLPEGRRQNVARETLEIYAPLAHRLGMGKVRGELEDLAFRYVDSIGYEQVRAAVEARRKAGEKFLAGVVKTLQEKLKENGVEALVESRIKRRSADITALYPRMKFSLGESGASGMRRLLDLVPDVIRFDGFNGYIINPLETDLNQYIFNCSE